MAGDINTVDLGTLGGPASFDLVFSRLTTLPVSHSMASPCIQCPSRQRGAPWFAPGCPGG